MFERLSYLDKLIQFEFDNIEKLSQEDKTEAQFILYKIGESQLLAEEF